MQCSTANTVWLTDGATHASSGRGASIRWSRPECRFLLAGSLRSSSESNSGGQPVAFADIRLTSLTLAADIFSSLAVSLTPHPSSRAARISSTRNGAVLGLPNRLPNDRARSSPAITRSRIIARSNSLNTPSTDHSATGFRDHQAQRGRGQENRQQAKDRQGQSLPDAARANRQ